MDLDVKQDLHVLSIKDAVPEDAGVYKLTVVNDMGSVSITVKVTERTSETVTTEETGESYKKEVSVEERRTREEEVVKDLGVEGADKDHVPREPKIEVAPRHVTFEEGETIMLFCRVSG